MNSLLFVSLVLMGQPQDPLRTSVANLGDLDRVCTRSEASHVTACFKFLEGFVWGAQAASLSNNRARPFCLPASWGDVQDVVREELVEMRRHSTSPAGFALLDILKRRFPCEPGEG